MVINLYKVNYRKDIVCSMDTGASVNITGVTLAECELAARRRTDTARTGTRRPTLHLDHRHFLIVQGRHW